MLKSLLPWLFRSQWIKRLKYPQLFVLMAAVFALDVAIPDFVPFVEEILLGLGTLLLASIKDRSDQRQQSTPNHDDEDVIDSTARPK